MHEIHRPALVWAGDERTWGAYLRRLPTAATPRLELQAFLTVQAMDLLVIDREPVPAQQRVQTLRPEGQAHVRQFVQPTADRGVIRPHRAIPD